PPLPRAHPAGDLMPRASSGVPAVKALVGFGAVSLAATAFAFAGALLAMLAVDPWLTLWALAPYPAMIVLSKRFNAVVHERSQAAQDQLGVLSAKVQEYLAGKAVVDGRLTLGALAAFNGYLAYLAWPTIALGWTLSIVRRGLTSMQRIQEIIGARLVEPEEKVGLASTESGRSSSRPPTVRAGL